jgi:hypothetical protein
VKGSTPLPIRLPPRGQVHTLATCAAIVALVLPNCIAWRAEYANKAEYLRARRRRLRLAVPLLPRLAAWLDARGFWPGWSSGAAAPVLIGGALLLAWQAADLLVALANPACAQP